MSLYNKRKKSLLLILFIIGIIMVSGIFVMSVHPTSQGSSTIVHPMGIVALSPTTGFALNVSNVTSVNSSINATAWIKQVLNRVLEFTVSAVLAIAVIVGLWLAIPVMFGTSDQKVSALDRLKHWAIGLVIIILIASGTLIALLRGFLGF